MATLVFHLDDATSMTHSLDSGTTTLGRHPDSVIVLDCPSVSGHHAIIEVQEDGVYVIDQQSSNGTRVNGATIEEAKLADGDRVGFGDIQAVYYVGEAPALDEEAPSSQAEEEAVIFVPQPEIPAKDAPPPPAPVDYRKAQSNRRPPQALRKTSSYPDTTESGCMTALIVIFLFVASFFVGLHMRHYKETEGGNFFSDVMGKLSGSIPKIKVEK